MIAETNKQLINMIKIIDEIKAKLIEQTIKYKGPENNIKDIKELGTKDNPIKASSTPALLGCSKRFTCRVLDNSFIESKATQKGSLAGNYIYLALNDFDYDEVLPILKKKATLLSETIKDNTIQKAKNLINFLKRNALGGKIRLDLMEKRMTYKLGKFWFSGAADFVIEDTHCLRVYDFKFTKKGVNQSFYDYSMQLLTLKALLEKEQEKDVKIGGIIRINSFTSEFDTSLKAKAICSGNIMFSISDLENKLTEIQKSKEQSRTISETCIFCNKCFSEVKLAHQDSFVMLPDIDEKSIKQLKDKINLI